MDIMRTNMYTFISVCVPTMKCHAMFERVHKKSPGTNTNNRQINDVWHEVDEIAATEALCLSVCKYLCA